MNTCNSSSSRNNKMDLLTKAVLLWFTLKVTRGTGCENTIRFQQVYLQNQDRVLELRLVEGEEVSAVKIPGEYNKLGKDVVRLRLPYVLDDLTIGNTLRRILLLTSESTEKGLPIISLPLIQAAKLDRDGVIILNRNFDTPRHNEKPLLCIQKAKGNAYVARFLCGIVPSDEFLTLIVIREQVGNCS